MAELTITLDGQEIARHTVPVITRAQPMMSIGAQHPTARIKELEELLAQKRILEQELNRSLSKADETITNLRKQIACMNTFASHDGQRITELEARIKSLDAEQNARQAEQGRADEAHREIIEQHRTCNQRFKELWPEVSGSLTHKVNMLIAYYQATVTKLQATERAHAVLRDKLHDIDTVVHKEF